VLDGNTIIPYQNVNGNVFNSEDIMSIPTSLTRVGYTAPVAEEAELLMAA